ncbi:hypothetical protein ACO0OL_000718 [Hanseniaspora opuntiae]
MTQFGADFKKKYYTYLDPAVNVVNHGSYGTTPSMIIDAQIASVKKHESYPDEYEYIEGPREYKRQAKLIAQYLGLNWENLALVQNATTGINVFFRSIPFDFENDIVVLPSTTYGACSNTVKFMNVTYGLKYKTIDLTFPLTTKEIVAKFEHYFKNLSCKGKVYCLFDCISSMPGVVMPYIELIKLCKKYNVVQVIDGAHAPGQVDLKFLDKLKPDFFTGNLHKWVSVPKSCAIIYAQKKWHHLLQTQPVSWTYNVNYNNIKSDESLLVERFSKVGTINYSVYESIEAAIKFRSEVCGGETNIRNYQKTLSKQAVEACSKVLAVNRNTTTDTYDHYEPVLLDNKQGTLTPVGMFCLSIPINTSKYSKVYNMLKKSPFDYLARIRSLLEEKSIAVYKNYAPLVFHGDVLYVRFSVQIFNEVSDFVKATTINKTLLEDVFTREEERLSFISNKSKL